MQIDINDAAKKSLAIAGTIGLTVALPPLAAFLIPTATPFLAALGTSILATIGGVGSNAFWDMRDSFKPADENESLAKLLGSAYSAAIADILMQEQQSESIAPALKGIKDDLDTLLTTGKEVDYLKLFPNEENLLVIELDGQKKLPFFKRLLGKEKIEYKAVGKDLLSQTKPEDFILKLSEDGELAKAVVAEEVELTLRRWFVQAFPSLKDKYTFPPSADKTIFVQIGELIPSKINRLVKQEGFSDSWIAFQRSHLQAIHKQVTNKQNGLSDEDRELLKPLGEFLNKLSENDELVKKLADGHLEILGKIGVSEENIKKCIADESNKLQEWIREHLVVLTERIVQANQGIDQANEKLDGLQESFDDFRQLVQPRRRYNSVLPPDMEHRIYGRKDEIAELLRFLEDEKEHAAIVGFTCWGKTSVVRKFLNKNFDREKYESRKPEIFTDVLYLDCGQIETAADLETRFAVFMAIGSGSKYADKRDYWQSEVFPQFGERKVLLIIDNFENWLTDGEYKNADIKDFLKAFFAHPHNARAVFLSWYNPNVTTGFSLKVKNLTAIENSLKNGLNDDDAIRLVRNESQSFCTADSIVDLQEVSEGDLIKFFEKVDNNPQSIQAMVRFIEENQCTFADFLKIYQAEFDRTEASDENLADRRNDLARPAKAMLNLQISLLDKEAKDVLLHTAFYDIDVPHDLLVWDENDNEHISEENLKNLNSLVKNHLLIRSVNRWDKTPFQLYNVHNSIRSVIADELQSFRQNHESKLINLADQMQGKCNDAFNGKLPNKHFALAECWGKLEEYLGNALNFWTRVFSMDLANISKALAMRGITEANAAFLTAEQRSEFLKNTETIYLDFIGKYENYYAIKIEVAIIYNNLGVLLCNQERWSDAEKNYLKAIEKNPNYAEAYNNLGVLLTEDKNRWGDAEKNYLKAIELDSNDASAYNNLGNLLCNQERWSDAEKNYLKAIEKNPNDAEAYNNLGVLLTEDKNRWSEAEEKYLKAIEKNPNDASAYFNMACLRSLSQKEENKEECFGYLKRAIELDSKFKELATDPDFDFVRDDVRFKKLVGE